jgi:hypothetical protein
MTQFVTALQIETRWSRRRRVVQVLRGKANGIGSGPKFRMPALEVAA